MRRRSAAFLNPIIRSRFPIKPSLIPLALIPVFAAAAVVAFAFEAPCPATIALLLAGMLFVVEIDWRTAKVCPHCRQRSLRIIGTGGIWYEDFREERVYWGECSSCGKSAIRRGSLSANWTPYPEGNTNHPAK